MRGNRCMCWAGAWLVAAMGCESNEPVPGPPIVLPDGPVPAANRARADKAAVPGIPSSSELTLVEAVTREDLSKVVCSTISPDGKFLYASGWKPGALVVFARDLDTGKLTHVQTISGEPDLSGATGVALSPDGRFAFAAAFHSKIAVLFGRDPDSGKLTQLDMPARAGKDWEFPVSAKFSPDGKFVCVVDDGGREGSGGVRRFRVEGEKLVDLGMDEGRNRCFYGARSLAFHPDGKTLFVAASRPGSLVVVDFDGQTGATKVRQILWSKSKGGHDFSKADVGDVNGTRALVDVVTTADGGSVITCAGRFGGETALTSFRYGADGHLSFVTTVKGFSQGAHRFSGGNQLAVTPDGRAVYAAGTLSGVIACAACDPETGSLSPREVIPDGGPPGGPGVNGAAGVTVSPDAKFVYVATEDKNTLAVFRRKRP